MKESSWNVVWLGRRKEASNVDDKYKLDHWNIAMEMYEWTRSYTYKKGINKTKLCEKNLEYWLCESMINEKNAKMRGKNAHAYEKKPQRN